MEVSAPAPALQQGRHTSTAHQAPATSAIACSSTTTCSGHMNPNSLLGFVLAGAALLTIALVCFALLFLMKKLTSSMPGAHSRNSHNNGQQPVSSSGDAIDAEAATKELGSALQDARLVVFPGEQKPRALAVPAELLAIVVISAAQISEASAIKALESGG
ncbi:hypothetical protein GOP47_0003188 [Adiantum capillus-veneris]|uniref:Uncharacterized protein n=1 Tax=Adiantum capillus-veneris TaxID=13818 RepID=A0A9D4VBH8_ADICA|nr:hypothetical protein GOP47_0003188 [Adiantum capillus-veneris]